MAPSGTVNECLDQLRRLERDDIRKLIDFTGAHHGTVSGWLLGTSAPPTGEALIKVGCFFELSGWTVTEFENANPLAADMARYWACGVLTADEIKTGMGYALPSDNTALLSFFYGKRRPSAAINDKLAQLLNVTRSAYEQRASELREQYAVDIPTEPEAPAAPGRKQEVVKMLAELLREAHPLALRVDSEDYSDELRAMLLKLVGTDRYVELSTALNRMTGWRTRQMVQSREGQQSR